MSTNVLAPVVVAKTIAAQGVVLSPNTHVVILRARVNRGDHHACLPQSWICDGPVALTDELHRGASISGSGRDDPSRSRPYWKHL